MVRDRSPYGGPPPSSSIRCRWWISRPRAHLTDQGLEPIRFRMEAIFKDRNVIWRAVESWEPETIMDDVQPIPALHSTDDDHICLVLILHHIDPPQLGNTVFAEGEDFLEP
ncbi:hypothetical protein PF001_g29427 [Phytophthora fragariae]|uniref:Uncharacterized protein n=1 Tax=Phytophthora fragariae TaxID=53985 RepID=A0A6A3E4Y0_9STRA|nr:hypothetical protein PF003_g21356 [Phytophthora fragariae]KAE8928645.1 hypothetical protein PF009_g21217 [Phytophthora fragariae]KAE9069431.1 hypothetical protein PF006_g29579 [Phytophthora fragariae]KAE9268979.1 hypothetical protein PF001_g29427 [Phytophthora fragariae]